MIELKAQISQIIANKAILIEANNLPPSIRDLEGVDLRISISKYRKQRSLNANAYLWALLGQLARVLNTTANELYINYLQSTPIFYKDDDGYDTMYVKSGKKVDGHWFFLKTIELTQGAKKGKLDLYARLKGSSEFDSKEMSDLIDIVVEDCKAQGIDTMPPEEIERMVNLWSQ